VGEYLDEDLDSTFAALAHTTRRGMIRELSERGEAVRVTDLAQNFECSLNVASKHIKSLERAGLVTRKKEGRVHALTLNTVPLKQANSFLERYRERWERQFDRLESYLDEMVEEEES